MIYVSISDASDALAWSDVIYTKIQFAYVTFVLSTLRVIGLKNILSPFLMEIFHSFDFVFIETNPYPFAIYPC